MRPCAIAAAVAIAVTPALGFEDADGTLASLPSPRRSQLIEIIDLAVVDGKHARLRKLRAGTQNACGLINMRTRGGTYTGYIPFSVNFPEARLTLFPEEEKTDVQKAQLNLLFAKRIEIECALADAGG